LLPQNPQQSVIASDKKEGVCSIDLVIYGPMSPNDSLLFPTGDQSLGPVEGSVGGMSGWFWQIEVRGTVAGDASQWFLGQRATTSESGQFRGVTGTVRSSNKVTRDQPDNPNSLYRQQPRGQSNFFSVDGPGPLKLPGIERVSTTTVQNFFTYVERGNNRCGVKWSLTTEVQNDRLIRQVLRP
jgi:hypothetical protein